tara:strand:- start:420 stop:1028 length:609 start_codon:yes stop_codon:yes gene_type:complete
MNKNSNNKIFVTLVPLAWHKFYQKLELLYKKNDNIKTKPPVPLILNGWVFTSDEDKIQRWNDTVSWLTSYNLEYLLDDITEEDKYYVEKDFVTTYDDLARFYRIHANREPRDKPDEKVVDNKLIELVDNWETIAGTTLSNCTKPVEFTGLKFRRLVCSADINTKPPWGEWDLINKNPISFRNFRKRVNSFIKPLEVDHIDFI